MAIRKTNGLDIKRDSVSRKDFLKLCNVEPDIPIEIRGLKVLVSEKITVLPSRLDIAQIHRPMDAEGRANAISSMNLKREYRIVQSNVEDIVVGSEPLIDWENTVAIKRIDFRNNGINLIRLSASFSAMTFADRTLMIQANKPITVTEYLLIPDYGILGSYING